MELDIQIGGLNPLTESQEKRLVSKMVENKFAMDKDEDTFFLESQNKTNLFKSYFTRLLEEAVYDNKIEYDALVENIEEGLKLIDLKESYDANFNIADLHLYSDMDMQEGELTEQIRSVSKTVKETVRTMLKESASAETKDDNKDNFLYVLFESIRKDALKAGDELTMDTQESLKKAVRVAKLSEVFNMVNLKLKTTSPKELEEKFLLPLIEMKID